MQPTSHSPVAELAATASAPSSNNPAAKLKPPQRAAIDASFSRDANLREALTENLKPLKAESQAIASRVQRTFEQFNPSQLSADELERRHYVTPQTPPGSVLDAVIMQGVHALRSSGNRGTVTLRATSELKGLMQQTTGDSQVVQLAELIGYINRKQQATTLFSEPVYTLCKAELEAERILGAAEKPEPAAGNGAGTDPDSAADSSDTIQFVKDRVNLQMRSATSPESRLQYASIPNNADQDKVQSQILQTFELRPGASDVTSYHDFNTLQIAFAHVWPRIFDGQLATLGREVYEEYVRLKDFSGGTDPDPTISTLDDLRRLIEQVKSLTNFTAIAVPTGNSAGNGSTTAPPPASTKDWTDYAKQVVPDPVSHAVLDWFKSMFAGKQMLTWDSFPAPMRGENIRVDFEENAVVAGEVEIVIAAQGSDPWKLIDFKEFNAASELQSQFKISNDPRDNSVWDAAQYNRLPLYTGQLRYAVLEFFGETDSVVRAHRSYYVMAGLTEKIRDRMRVTFTWL